MEIEPQVQGASWRWSLLLSVVFLNVCIPSLLLSYGVLLVHLVSLEVPAWLGLSTPAVYILVYGLSQCWCREAADSWGGSVGYRMMATLGLVLVLASLLLCSFTPYYWQPVIYGVFGGLGSSLISAQVDAVIFETYDSYLPIIRGLCFTGQAIGLSIFPHIMTALINYYGYPMSYIVLGGIMLQTLPAIMLIKVDSSIRRPLSFSRYSDLSKTYAVFSNGEANNYYATELQLQVMSKKSWKSPSDGSLDDEDEIGNEVYVNYVNETITPPPSPEEKRRNIFGVEILPEIPEESEDSDDNDKDDQTDQDKENKKRLSVAIKRFSIMGDNLSDYITKQIRRDSQSSFGESREYTEVVVTYDNISPITDIEREKIFNSFSFRCQSAYASMRRRMWMPSYKVYRIRRRLLYFMYNINDTFIKPFTRSLSCWRFYPALMLYFSRLSLTAITLTLLPMIASQMKPEISLTETNFLLTLHGFTWICFLLCTPWLAQTPKRNFKYVAVLGLIISTGTCFLLAEAKNHDMFAIGCVVGGLGYGAITSCCEAAVQDIVGARKWPKLQSTLETLSAIVLAVFVLAISFLINLKDDIQYLMFILGITLAVITVFWLILAAVSTYFANVRSLRGGRRWIL